MANKYPQEAKKKREEAVAPASKKECTHPRRLKRQESAKRCAEERASRTDEQQLKHLDKLLGKNKGAKKERARLKNKIKNAKAKTPNKKGEKQVR